MAVSFSGSLDISGSLTTTGTIVMSGSIASASYAALATTASNANTSSYVVSSQTDETQNTRLTTIEAVTGSYASTSSLSLTSASVAAINVKTGSYATTGSNYFIGTQVITGSVYIANDLIVQGSSSLQNITASAVSIGTNTVILNTDSPAVRFAGISVRDSGSNSGVTSSIWYDSLNNKWIYQNESGSSYSGGMFISGPRNTGSLGEEAGMTSGYIAKGLGGDHIGSSIIFESGSTNIGIGTSTPTEKLYVQGKILGIGKIFAQRESNGADTLIQFKNEVGADRAYINFGGANEELGFYSGAGGTRNMIIGSDGAMGFNYPTLGVRSFMFRALADRPLAIEVAESGGVHSLYFRPNSSGRHLITSNYLSGGAYLPLALSGRENDADFVLNAGNVGIGTTNPSQIFHAASTGVTRLLVHNTNNQSTGAGIQMLVSNSGTTVGNGTIRTDNSDNMQFYNNSIETMRIAGPSGYMNLYSQDVTSNRTTTNDVLTITQTSGNAPYSGFGSNILFRGTTYSGTSNNSPGVRNWGRIGMYLNDAYDNFSGESMYFQVAADDRSDTLTTAMTITYQGRVGIGTATPNAQLNVGHNGHGVGISYLGGSSLPSLAGIYTSDGTAGGQTGYGSLLIKARTDYGNYYSLNFYTAASDNTPLERMRITSGGHIGIGTTPSSWASPFITIQGGTYGQHIGFQTNGADMKIGSNNYYNGSGYIYTVSSYGATQLNIGASSAGGYFSVSAAPSGTAGNAVTFTERFRVDSDGSIVVDNGGVGTRSYIRMGRFSNSLTNAGEAWLGRASDRSVGQMTVQLGSYNTNTFEVVDYGWTKVAFYVNGSGNYDFYGSDVSDRRQKDNITYITNNQLDTIMNLKPASFNKKNGIDGLNENVHTGFIAQDVLESNIPNLVHGSEEDGYGLDYNGILSLAVKSIQELKTELDIANQKIAALESRQ